MSMLPPVPALALPAELAPTPTDAEIIPFPTAQAPTRRDANVSKARREATKARESYSRAHQYRSTPREDVPLANHVRNLFQEARDAKRPLIARWNANYLYLRNRPQAIASPGSRSTPLVPEIFPICASKVGWKSDTPLRTEVSSSAVIGTDYYDETSTLAMDLAAVLDATYQVNLEAAEVMKLLWDAEMYGTGILKTTWDCALAGGLGDAVTRRIDPYTFYPDPQARSEADANYFIEARTMSIQEADRRWPGSARVLSTTRVSWETDEAPTQLGGASQFPRANPGAITPGHIPQYGLPGQSGYHVTDTEGVTVLECWMRTHDAITDETAPYGYRIEETWRVVVLSGNHILFDEPATNLWSHGQHPYSRHVPHDIGEFWGFSTVELLIPTQRSINRLLSAMQTNVELSGNPVMVDDMRAGISRTQATNRPGARYTVGSGSRVDWMKPPPVNPQFMELIRYMLQRMEAVSGLSAVTRGGSSPGRNAQGVMDAMQEAAFVRVRMELKQLEYTLTDAGKKKASLICENYTEARNLAILGSDGAQKMLSIKPRHFMVPSIDGEIPLQYTLLIDAGASQHTNRKVREDLILSLLNMGAIDVRAALDFLNVPGRYAITQRVEAQQQMMAAQGQQAGG